MSTFADALDIVSLSHGPAYGDGLVMAMVCYLDDSDHNQSSIATLAGYVASVDNWKIVEQDLEAVCQRYSVDILHAKEFHQTKGCFKRWSRTRKQQFVDDLYARANQLTWGVSFSGAKNWRDVKHQVPGHERMSLFGVMFASIMFQLVYGNPFAKLFQRDGLSFMIESGHRNNSELEQYFHNMRGFDTYKGKINSISFVSKDSSRAIQLADFLAFHSRRWAALHAASPNVIFPKEGILKRIYTKVPHLESVVKSDFKFIRPGTLEEAAREMGESASFIKIEKPDEG